MGDKLLFGALALLTVLAVATAEPTTSEWKSEVTTLSSPRKSRFFGLFGRRCQIDYPVCPLNCEFDSAVVHGSCCGCGGFFDFAPVHCPHWLQCPISPEPLCSDYRFVMDCCCG